MKGMIRHSYALNTPIGEESGNGDHCEADGPSLVTHSLVTRYLQSSP